MDYIKCIENLVISNIYTVAKQTLNSFKFQPDTLVILRRGIDYHFAHKRGMFPYWNHECSDRLRFVKAL